MFRLKTKTNISGCLCADSRQDPLTQSYCFKAVSSSHNVSLCVFVVLRVNLYLLNEKYPACVFGNVTPFRALSHKYLGTK